MLPRPRIFQLTKLALIRNYEKFGGEKETRIPVFFIGLLMIFPLLSVLQLALLPASVSRELSMASTIEIGGCRIELESEITAAIYSKLPLGSGCNCKDCQNFDLVFPTEIPEGLRKIAAQLGIDLLKPAEVAHYGEDAPNRHIVGPWYHFVGRVVGGGQTIPGFGSLFSSKVVIPPDSEYSINGETNLVRDEFANLPLVQFEVLTRIPWRLDDSKRPDGA